MALSRSTLAIIDAADTTVYNKLINNGILTDLKSYVFRICAVLTNNFGL